MTDSPPPPHDPLAPTKEDAMAALKMYVDLANSERQAIWIRHSTMIVGNSVLISATRLSGANPDTTLLFNAAGLLLCVVWGLMTWFGWGWFYDPMKKGKELSNGKSLIDKSLNPFANIKDLDVRWKDSIFIFAVLVVAIFAAVYLVNLWPPIKALICR